VPPARRQCPQPAGLGFGSPNSAFYQIAFLYRCASCSQAKKRRGVHQRPRDRDALPLPARQPGRVGVLVLPDPQSGQQLGGASPGRRLGLPAELGGQQHVVEDGHVLEQVEELEDHPDLPAAEPGHGGLAEPVHPLAADPDRSAARPVQPGDQVEQRGLPAARGPHDGHGLAGLDRHADIRHRRGSARAQAVIVLCHVFQLNQGFHLILDPVTTGGACRT
jgi:hypothetical protein